MAEVIGVEVRDEEERGSIVARHISMYPQDWAVVHQLAKDAGLSRSAGLRYIVRDWLRLKERERLVNAFCDGHITGSELDEALSSSFRYGLSGPGGWTVYEARPGVVAGEGKVVAEGVTEEEMEGMLGS